MSNSALAISQASATKWTVISGSMKGAVRLMNTPVFVVGRSPECEFVIVNDPKCSRRHAQIESNGNHCEVVSLNDKNLVSVNGREVERAQLQDGDIILFGDTKVQFETTMASTGSHLVPAAEFHPEVVFNGPTGGGGHAAQGFGGFPAAMPMSGAPAPQISARPRGKPRSAQKPANNKRLYIYGTIGLIILWIMWPTKTKTKAALEQQIKHDIEVAQQLREADEKASLKHFDDSITSRQAQENYVRGFRDYQKGQFERSLFSFQACLALNPEHVLCNRYLRLSQRKFDETVQSEMVLGTKYRNQNQYKACRSSFRNVMVMVKDANSQVFQQAKANYDACDSLVEGRF